jgi:hypothetical protein
MKHSPTVDGEEGATQQEENTTTITRASTAPHTTDLDIKHPITGKTEETMGKITDTQMEDTRFRLYNQLTTRLGIREAIGKNSRNSGKNTVFNKRGWDMEDVDLGGNTAMTRQDDNNE